jgi:hypothetical protein
MGLINRRYGIRDLCKVPYCMTLQNAIQWGFVAWGGELGGLNAENAVAATLARAHYSSTGGTDRKIGGKASYSGRIGGNIKRNCTVSEIIQI